MKHFTPFSKRIGNLSIYVFGSLIAFSFIAFFLLSFFYDPFVLLYEKTFLVSALTFLISVIVLLIYNHRELKQQYDSFPLKFKDTVIFLAQMYVLVLFSNLILGSLAQFLAGTPSVANQDTIVTELFSNPALTFVTTVIFAPFVEEMVFRYSLMDVNSDNKRNQYLWLIISSLVFGFVHIILSIQNGQYSESWYILQYAGMGLVIGYSYLKTKNIWIPILLHSLMNLISTVLIYFIG